MIKIKIWEDVFSFMLLKKTASENGLSINSFMSVTHDCGNINPSCYLFNHICFYIAIYTFAFVLLWGFGGVVSHSHF